MYMYGNQHYHNNYLNNVTMPADINTNTLRVLAAAGQLFD